MDPHDHAIEEPLDVLIVDGQSCEMWIRSEPDTDGTWHNAALFRRNGKLSPGEALTTGLEWHLPPGFALERARELAPAERLELYQRALRPRPPLA